jgi:hypothetical protein
VIAAELTQGNDLILNYDREKYKELLLDAIKTVLGIFGFDRTLYGKARDKKWWDESRKKRVNDMKAEYN